MIKIENPVADVTALLSGPTFDEKKSSFQKTTRKLLISIDPLYELIEVLASEQRLFWKWLDALNRAGKIGHKSFFKVKKLYLQQTEDFDGSLASYPRAQCLREILLLCEDQLAEARKILDAELSSPHK